MLSFCELTEIFFIGSLYTFLMKKFVANGPQRDQFSSQSILYLVSLFDYF